MEEMKNIKILAERLQEIWEKLNAGSVPLLYSRKKIYEEQISISI